MYISGKIKVSSVIPEELSGLKDISYNLWWSWNPDAINLFKEIDPHLWEKVLRNPVKFIQEVSQNRLIEKLSDSNYMKKYEKVMNGYNSYMTTDNTWFKSQYSDLNTDGIAYFSAEYGLSEILPVYSGGLGVLSGDHCKSASDLGLPFTAVGLLYKRGYFRQYINHEGWQETVHPGLNPSQLPLTRVFDDEGNHICIDVELPGRMVFAKIWKVCIGRINLYLLDTDIEENSPEDRSITGILYGGNQETRIQQEIILGIGGLRALKALGIKPEVFHMNEGHSAFLGLELIRTFMNKDGLTYQEAREIVSSCLVFTTHTPVPAGNDVFPFTMIDKYFGNYWGALRINRHEFMDLGSKPGDHHNFNMTILALKLAGRKNGVSKLHGAVSRNIFNNIWPNIPEDEIPIKHITNGIHSFTWLNKGLKSILNRYLDSEWQQKLHIKKTWDKVDNIPNNEIWKTHFEQKNDMIRYIRKRLIEQRMRNGESIESIREAENILNPKALIIGFARRFATYKRANLIFRNIDRIKRIINNPKMPVQIIFAGKAHPADQPAHEIIKNINDISRQTDFRGKIILVENYNIRMAHKLVHGVDVWLNNPRRPLEASGTSGQKAALNGILNFSVLDGWWCEGYNGDNGWVIGRETFYDDEFKQDNGDSESLYDILEQQIVPLYYNKDETGIPQKWVDKMKQSIKTLSHQYSTNRMVIEYTEKMYIPSITRMQHILTDEIQIIKKLAEWKHHMKKNWPHVNINAERTMDRLKHKKSTSGKPISLSAEVQLGDIDPSDVKVEVYYGKMGTNGSITNPKTVEMELNNKKQKGLYNYATNLEIPEGGEYGYTFRVVAYHPDLIYKFDTNLIRWIV